ncbi:MAG: AAA family ATPase, partial [Clostridia bacterium]|nr:AAA family ATPase [Clostridia bacterium]
RGYKTAIFSGELQSSRFQSWIDQMAAGKTFVQQKAGFENIYYAPKRIADQVNQWLDDKLYLYNNDYGSNWDQLYQEIVTIIHEKGVRLVMIDNLMALDFDSESGDQNTRETRFIKQFKDLCKRENIHGILVCHPRKEQSFQLLRKESIAGTANLTNLCDNLIISHRVGNDFVKRAKDFFGEAKVAELMAYDVVLEVVKNRSIGVTDYLIGLYYEAETRRIKNDVAENIIFGWQEQPVQTTFEEPETEPQNEEIDDLPF